jgi:hypothetical protein
MVARQAPSTMKTQPHLSDREVLAGLVDKPERSFKPMPRQPCLGAHFPAPS